MFPITINCRLSLPRVPVLAFLGFVAFHAIPVNFASAKERAITATRVLEEASDALAVVAFVEGEFIHKVSKEGHPTQRMHGTFKVARPTDSPPRCEIVFFNKSGEKAAVVRSDGSLVSVRRWPETSGPATPSGRKIKTRCANVFRGGTTLLHEATQGVAAQFLQTGYLDKLRYYRPTLVDEAMEDEQEIEVAIPDRSWNYCFDRATKQLARLTVTVTNSDLPETTTTEYRNLKIMKADELNDAVSPGLGTLPDSHLVTAGPFDRLLGEDVSGIVVDWSDGRRGTLADQHGKVVVIDFWASWCGPCLQELPSFVELAKQYSKEDIMFICAPWRDSEERARSTAERYEMLDLVSRVSPEAFRLDDTGIPCIFVIDRHGKVADFMIGSHGASGKRHLARIIEQTARQADRTSN